MPLDVSELRGNWNYPTTLWFGCGRIVELPKACVAMGITKPLLVTDAGLAKLPMVDDALTNNRAAGMPTAIFSDIKLNPNGNNIADGVRQYCPYCRHSHDGGYRVGGGAGLGDCR